MKTVLSRDELYDLIWSNPIKDVAPKFDVSDVALSKICRKHNIPRPPRGYWAKLAAGKPASKAPLPKREIGMPRMIELDRKKRWHSPLPNNPDEIKIPPDPQFSESIEELFVRFRKSVGAVKVPTDLHEGHNQIRKLVEADDERRREQAKRSYHSSFDATLFDTPFERRRLRILNAIFLSLGRCGVRATFRGKDPDQFDFVVGEQQMSFTLDHPGIKRIGSRWGDDTARPASLPIHLEINGWNLPEDLQLVWKDRPGKNLEKQLAEVIVTMTVAGELRYRAHEAWQRNRLIEHKANLIEEAGLATERRKQALLDERHQQEKVAIDRLLAQAEDFQHADTIRLYVRTAQVANSQSDCPISEEQISEWAKRSLAHADRIDPVKNGAFLLEEDVESYDSDV